MSVKVEYFKDGSIAVYSPYNDEFIKVARGLSGKWDSCHTRWIFPRSVAEKIKAEVIDIFGENGESLYEVIVEVNVNKFMEYKEKRFILSSRSEIYLFNRIIACRKSLYSEVKLDNFTNIVKGGFKYKGGKHDDIRLAPKEDTILEIKKVPIDLFMRELNDFNLRDNNDILYRVKKELEIPNYIKSLKEEKDNLSNRINEIDNILNKLSTE